MKRSRMALLLCVIVWHKGRSPLHPLAFFLLFCHVNRLYPIVIGGIGQPKRHDRANFFCIGNTDHGKARQDPCTYNEWTALAKARLALVAECANDLSNARKKEKNEMR